MTQIPSHFKLNTKPIADPNAVIQIGQARFTILTSRLIRMEYCPDENFEDRPSQVFWYRRQPVPSFEVKQTGKVLEIITDHLHLKYTLGQPFDRETLSIQFSGNYPAWYFGDAPSGNLFGTARTLDVADGRIPLEAGLISRSGWVVVDDSRSLVFNPQGWLESRQSSPGAMDLYFFGYGSAYQDCLSDFCKISGVVPMPPRWALGNWWSRYWAYTQSDLEELMQEFKSHQIPLSVCIIDMDWHLTQTGNKCSGWTGYTWNRELFPDPPGFLKYLDELDLKKSLNLHPAEGIHPHEEMYPQMAQAMGIDPRSKKPVKFDPEDPRFVEAYFDLLHHPKEAQGIDFWWIDWQQGNPSALPRLNLLWWINHLHFMDSGRDPEKRPFIFSRWGGLGNHRYPIGFSGDTFITWNSLAFQPYFTATAANVGYSWWSHDIGGHMGGTEDAELYTRWVQFGVFSPILRLHSTNNPFHERRPWGFDAETEKITKHALQLRHALIPYLYSMAWLNHRDSIPPIRPMYYLHPENEQAYTCPNQYTFGTELISAPFITPQDEDTRLSRQVVWLPPGEWFDFFTGDYYPGDTWQAIYGKLEDIPVFARAGAIVPLADLPDWGGIGNPENLNIHIFPGASNQFELYEDDGESQAYLNGKYSITQFFQDWSLEQQIFQILPTQGHHDHLPDQRKYILVFHAIQHPDQIQAALNGEIAKYNQQYDPDQHTLRVSGINLSPSDSLKLVLSAGGNELMLHRTDLREKVYALLRAFRLASYTKEAMYANLGAICEDPAALAAYKASLTDSQLRAMLETITGAGIEHIKNAGEELIILWNNRQEPFASLQLSQETWFVPHPSLRFQHEKGILSKFKVFRPGREFLSNHTQLEITYGNLLNLVLDFTRTP
jgi:alpha-glucosidase (family GH31 glycosyl hydrolase)